MFRSIEEEPSHRIKYEGTLSFCRLWRGCGELELVDQYKYGFPSVPSLNSYYSWINNTWNLVGQLPIVICLFKSSEMTENENQKYFLVKK